MKKATQLLICLLLSITFFACSKSSANKITITVAGGAVGNELELTKKAAALYMADHTNILIKVLETPDLANDRLGLYLQFMEARSPEVDVYQVDVIWPGDLAEHFVDLYEFGARDAADKHFKAIVENNEVDGKLVAMPWFTDAGLLYYRKDLLSKYQLPVPATWSELQKTALLIQEKERADGNPDFWGYLWQGNNYEGLTCNALEWFYSCGAGSIISRDKKITVNNPKARAALEMAASWVGSISPAAVTGMTEESARNSWQAGNALFMRNWPYAWTLGNSDESSIKDKFGAAPLPRGTDGQPAACLGGWNLAVSKYSRHPKIAADVALYLASAQGQKLRATEGSFIPTIKSLFKDKEVLAANPFFGRLYPVFINAVARPSTVSSPNYNNVSQVYYKAVHSVLTGKKKAHEALAQCAGELAKITGYK